MIPQRHRTQLARRLVWFFIGAVVLMAVGLFVVAIVWSRSISGKSQPGQQRSLVAHSLLRYGTAAMR